MRVEMCGLFPSFVNGRAALSVLAVEGATAVSRFPFASPHFPIYPSLFCIFVEGELPADRAAIEALFREGCLPVLCTTSTLAMGVNLPAHLVVVKSTQASLAARRFLTIYMFHFCDFVM
jgi:hypothetical protein